jgi:hypothetical protein
MASTLINGYRADWVIIDEIADMESTLMDEQREIYLDGYANGMAGNFYYDWDENDLNYFLSRVLKEQAHEKWWTTPQKWPDGSEETPRAMWSYSFATAKLVYDRVMSYLDPSFS